MKKLKIYIDTSVIGGCFDSEFETDLLQLIERIKTGQFILLLSDVVLSELKNAPAKVQTILTSIPTAYIEQIELTAEIFELQQAYLDAAILTEKWADDALHVACATVARADALISWNFKHIVRLDKMKAYNQINLLNGYGILTILVPKGVLTDESTDN